MQRRFCDNCSVELSERNDAQLTPLRSTTGGVQFEITPASVGFNDHGKGDVCRECVIDAVKALDTRPQAAPQRQIFGGGRATI